MRIPLVKPFLPRLEDIESDLRNMLESGRLTNFGPYSRLLENKTRDMLGVRHVASVSNATTGLVLLLNTLPKGSEVILPSFTFLPTVQAVLWNGLVPVFADIDPDSYNISPELLVPRITERTSAILAVHIFGNPCDVDALEGIAKSHNLKLFFDSAHAFGGKFNGKFLGGSGDAEVFSLSATKVLPCGEGGIITTNDDIIHQAILNRRNYGFKTNSRDCHNMGLNGKMTEFSAIIGVKEIESIGLQIEKRNEIARKYIYNLQGQDGISFQKINQADTSTYKDFTIKINANLFGANRDCIKSKLIRNGVGAEAYFCPAIHNMSYVKDNYPAKLPLYNTDQLEMEILSIPIYHDIANCDIDFVVNILRDLSNSKSVQGVV